MFFRRVGQLKDRGSSRTLKKAMTCFEQINDCDMTEMAKSEEEKEKEGAATCCSFSNSLAIQTARSVAIDYARFIHENVAHLSRFECPL